MSRQVLTVPVRAIALAVRSVLHSPDWLQALGDEDERTWLLTQSICDALHRERVGRVPSAQALQALLDRHHRDQQIIENFSGRNYAALARRHRLSERQVRRIVEHARQK